MIAINWGTSNFRAYKLDEAGNVEAERSSGRGAAQVETGGFSEALIGEVGDWLRTGETKVLMSGMVGSRKGWKEVPYVAAPASFSQVVAGVVPVEMDTTFSGSLDARIVPGLLGADDCGVPEVMRGEETEIFGMESAGQPPKILHEAQLCLPGTHTKWVRFVDGKISAFTTSMTGDLYKAIREGTILRGYPQEHPTDGAAFLRGVERSKNAGSVAHHLFGVRTLVLTGKLREASASSYLSGLLIGHEVGAQVQEGDHVHLIGDSALCSLYAKALRAFGVGATVEPEGAALRGLIRIAGSLAW